MQNVDLRKAMIQRNNEPIIYFAGAYFEKSGGQS